MGAIAQNQNLFQSGGFLTIYTPVKNCNVLPLSNIGNDIPPMGKPCVIRFSHRRRFPDLGFPIGGGRLPGQGFPIGGSRLPGQGFPIGILEEADWLTKQGF